MTARNFNNLASGASLNATLASGATTAQLNNFSNYPPTPFTATISRNQPDEEIVLVTAVAGTSVTLTRGYDGTAAQAHNAGASFEHTAVAKDFNESQQHVNATGAVHGLTGNIVGDSDAQTLTNKTVRYLKALASNASPAFEADNDAGATGKLFRGLQAGVEKFFVDYAGNITGQALAGTTGTFSGTLQAAAATFTSIHSTGAATVDGAATVTGLLTASGGVSVPAGKTVAGDAFTGSSFTATGALKGATVEATGEVLLDGLPGGPSGVAGKTQLWAITSGQVYATPPSGAAGQVRLVGQSGGSGQFPASPSVGDVYARSDSGAPGALWIYTSNGWRATEIVPAANAAALTALQAISPAIVYPGLLVRQTDIGTVWSWDGAKWAYNSGPKPAASLYQVTAQSIPASGVYSALALDGSAFDNFSGHSTSTNPSRYTVPTGWGGTYRVTGALALSVGSAAMSVMAALYVNGAVVRGGIRRVYTSSNDVIVEVTKTLQLAAGDRVEVWGAQTAGTTFNTTATAAATSSLDIDFQQS